MLMCSLHTKSPVIPAHAAQPDSACLLPASLSLPCGATAIAFTGDYEGPDRAGTGQTEGLLWITRPFQPAEIRQVAFKHLFPIFIHAWERGQVQS